MKWITGKDLLSPPYRKNPTEIFKAVTDGVIVPRIKIGPSLYPDPYEHRGVVRLLPSYEAEKENNRLGWLRYNSEVAG